ncbi:MAG: 6-bladed beta-propeller [Rikenellaceae bacterium]
MKTRITFIVAVITFITAQLTAFATEPTKIYDLLKEGEQVKQLVIVGTTNIYSNSINATFFNTLGINPKEDLAGGATVYQKATKLAEMTKDIDDPRKAEITSIVYFNLKEGVEVDIESIEESKIIDLEATKESLISNIYKIELIDNKFYVLDKASFAAGGKLLVFDEEGKYIRKIGNIGRARNEYVSLGGFAINQKN